LGRIPDEIIQQIRDRVDIVDLIGRHVTLKRSGRSYKGLCPFHGEKTPSFHVSPDRQSYYCFGCQEGGSALTFVMRHDHLTFPEAVRSLGRELGIEVPETGGARDDGALRLFAATEAAQDLYAAALRSPESEGARAYLRGRGLSDDDASRFGIGFAPDAWDFLGRSLERRGIERKAAERAGVLARSDSGRVYDRLRGRITFPIRDLRGRVVGFGGRGTREDQQPKYLNTSESPVFHKRRALFGLPGALQPMRRKDRAVVVEGYFDQIALARAGVEEAVATCGTALTEDHARTLRRQTGCVVLLFDGDAAGQRAVERSLEVLLPHGLRVRTAVLPPGLDPDDFLARDGADALRALVDEAPPALEGVIARAAAEASASGRGAFEKSDAVVAVAPLLALVQDPVERSEFAARLALAVGTETRHVEAALRAAARKDDRALREAVPETPRRSPHEERLLRPLVKSLVDHPHPRLAARVPRDELHTLVPVRALADLLATLVEAAGESRAVEPEEIGERLGDEARVLVASLAADEDDLDEAAALRAVDDTIERLRRREYERRQREITARLREPGVDHAALLREKQRLAEEWKKQRTRSVTAA